LRLSLSQPRKRNSLPLLWMWIAFCDP
jgi:hypothetical protein